MQKRYTLSLAILASLFVFLSNVLVASNPSYALVIENNPANIGHPCPEDGCPISFDISNGKCNKKQLQALKEKEGLSQKDVKECYTKTLDLHKAMDTEEFKKVFSVMGVNKIDENYSQVTMLNKEIIVSDSSNNKYKITFNPMCPSIYSQKVAWVNGSDKGSVMGVILPKFRTEFLANQIESITPVSP